jgi:hypothetical protein
MEKTKEEFLVSRWISGACQGAVFDAHGRLVRTLKARRKLKVRNGITFVGLAEWDRLSA